MLESKDSNLSEGKENTFIETDKKRKKKTSKVLLISLIGGSLILGGASGYLLYSNIHSDNASLAEVGDEGYIPSDEEIQSQISKDIDFTKVYKNKAYELINYALNKQASFDYALTIGTGSVVSSGVKQEIKSCNYTTPDVIYNQNVSSSWIVHTANRFYDHKSGEVSCYLKGTPDEWKKGDEPIIYSYDEYIQHYGKLLQGSYYCLTDSTSLSEEHPLSDVYLTNKKEEYDLSNEKSKHHVNGVVIYFIGPKSVKANTIKKVDDGYLITLDLFTDTDLKNEEIKKQGFISGSQYYGVQMRTTGGLSSRPPFSKMHLEFDLDNNFTLLSSTFEDAYTAKVGPINSGAEGILKQYYFHSDSNNFSGVDIQVPQPSDEDIFTGYQLFPKK